MQNASRSILCAVDGATSVWLIYDPFMGLYVCVCVNANCGLVSILPANQNQKQMFYWARLAAHKPQAQTEAPLSRLLTSTCYLAHE